MLGLDTRRVVWARAENGGSTLEARLASPRPGRGVRCEAGRIGKPDKFSG